MEGDRGGLVGMGYRGLECRSEEKEERRSFWVSKGLFGNIPLL
jgi:hypothetical protein